MTVAKVLKCVYVGLFSATPVLLKKHCFVFLNFMLFHWHQRAGIKGPASVLWGSVGTSLRNDELSGWFLNVVSGCSCIDTVGWVTGLLHLTCIKPAAVIMWGISWLILEYWVCPCVCVIVYCVCRGSFVRSFFSVWRSRYLRGMCFCLLASSRLIVHVLVTRCHPVHLVGRLSAILGRRSAQVICADQGGSFWCELPHFHLLSLSSLVYAPSSPALHTAPCGSEAVSKWVSV